MLDSIQDARQRHVVLIHPGAAQDAWYGAWYRARNDAWA
jgi:hypothetical protein